MIVNDLYLKCKINMFEKPQSTIYDNYVVEITNRVLAELFEENNMCRIFHGKAPYAHIPVLTSRTQELTEEDGTLYEDEYLLDVIPKGVDTYFEIDDDLSKYTIYNTDYRNARTIHQKMVSQEKLAKYGITG